MYLWIIRHYCIGSLENVMLLPDCLYLVVEFRPELSNLPELLLAL